MTNRCYDVCHVFINGTSSLQFKLTLVKDALALLVSNTLWCWSFKLCRRLLISFCKPFTPTRADPKRYVNQGAIIYLS